MTTNELIRQAMVCASTPTICVDCPYFDIADDCFNKLLVELAGRLEMAYDDLAWIRACHNCKYADKSLTDTECAGCNGQRWQWRGDVE